MAVTAGIPTASLSRFERGKAVLTDDQLGRLEATLTKAETPK
jgi:hypothetical protein